MRNRYFIELSYQGTNYSGFQVQDNAITIQSELERALQILFREKVELTGSSRTDAGVHAKQNFFHFDTELIISNQSVYNLNAILPPDIAVKAIIPVPPNAHCRFDAISRTYRYYIYRRKDPFLRDRAYFFPYKLSFEKLAEAAQMIRSKTDFTSFSKRNTQVKTFSCNILEAIWKFPSDGDDTLVFTITANRFLRGMVKALVATMLRTGRGNLTLNDLEKIFQKRDCQNADFAAPAQGLFLEKVTYREDIFNLQQ